MVTGDHVLTAVWVAKEVKIFNSNSLQIIDVESEKNNQKYIFTADRDEKIKISFYEKPYIIRDFCLGHSE